MSQVESYLVATIFVAISGFFFGYGMRTVEMLNANQLEKNPNSLFSIFGLLPLLHYLYMVFAGDFSSTVHTSFGFLRSSPGLQLQISAVI